MSGVDEWARLTVFLRRHDFLEDLAERFDTPLYVYSLATLERHYRVFDEAFRGIPHVVCFAVKANPCLALLDILARKGAGADHPADIG